MKLPPSKAIIAATTRAACGPPIPLKQYYKDPQRVLTSRYVYPKAEHVLNFSCIYVPSSCTGIDLVNICLGCFCFVLIDLQVFCCCLFLRLCDVLRDDPMTWSVHGNPFKRMHLYLEHQEKCCENLLQVEHRKIRYIQLSHKQFLSSSHKAFNTSNNMPSKRHH